MDMPQFQAMVSRLETYSAQHPRRYLLQVAALAALGFALLGVLVGVAGLGLLVLLGIALGLLFTGGGAWLALLKLGKLLIVLGIPLWFLVRSAFKALFVRLPQPQGEPVTAAQAPALHAAIADMRRKLKGPKVHQVLLVDELNAAMVQRPLFGLMGFPRNTMVLGLPLLESLSPAEAMAVVAHEYGHLAGSHGRFGAFIYRLRNTWGTIQELAGQWQGWLGKALGKAVAWYAPYFNAYTFVLARANEYQADQASADLVGAQAAASALKRAELAGAQYQRFIKHTFEHMALEPSPPADLCLRWASQSRLAPEQAPQWLAEALDRAGHPTDTHPSLGARLRALREAQPQQAPQALAGESAAQAWLGAALSQYRERFAQQWAQSVREPWAQRHEAIAAQRARLAELRGLAEHSRDEAFELLRLGTELEPHAKWREAAAAFNAAHPGDAPGLFLEGSLRLDADDEAGLALMERAMTLDGDAIKPGCQQAHRYCERHGHEAQARRYAERWNERDAMEQARAAQGETLDVKHPLQPHGLSEASLSAVRSLLAAAPHKGIAAVHLVRRLLPADPTATSYVLGVELTAWARFRDQEGAIVKLLAGQSWPFHVMVVALVGRYKGYRSAVQAVPGSRIG